MQGALAGAAALNVESRHETTAGAVQMEFCVSDVRDDADRLIGVSLVIRDSTERHRKQDLERERERRMSAEVTEQIEARRRQRFNMFELAPGFIAVTVGPGHVFDMAKRAYFNLFGERVHKHESVAAMSPEVADQPFLALRDQVYVSGEPYIGTGQRVVARSANGVLRERYTNFT